MIDGWMHRSIGKRKRDGSSIIPRRSIDAIQVVGHRMDLGHHRSDDVASIADLRFFPMDRFRNWFPIPHSHDPNGRPSCIVLCIRIGCIACRIREQDVSFLDVLRIQSRSFLLTILHMKSSGSNEDTHEFETHPTSRKPFHFFNVSRLVPIHLLVFHPFFLRSIDP